MTSMQSVEPATTTASAVETFSYIPLDDESRERVGAQVLDEAPVADDAEARTTRLHRAFAQLPPETLQAVLDFGRHARAAGVALVDNLPVDPVLPATPTDGGPSQAKATGVSEACLLGLSGLLGEPTGVTTEKAGQLVHDVIPVRTGATTQTNQGSAVFLNFHNDIIYDPSGIYTLSNPDFLVLLCVRSDPEGRAATYYADARDVARALDPEHLEELRKPLFRLNAPGSYCRQVGRDQVLGKPTALISGPEEYPEIAVSANGVEPLTAGAAAARDALQQTCREVAHQVHLRPGQALLINNRKGLHARSSFQAHHDGTDRWLQRSYVRVSLWGVRRRLHEQDQRVLM